MKKSFYLGECGIVWRMSVVVFEGVAERAGAGKEFRVSLKSPIGTLLALLAQVLFVSPQTGIPRLLSADKIANAAAKRRASQGCHGTYPYICSHRPRIEQLADLADETLRRRPGAPPMTIDASR